MRNRPKCFFVAAALVLLPAKLSAQGLVSQPSIDVLQSELRADLFAEIESLTCFDNEVVVALQGQGPGTLRALNYRNGAWVERSIVDLPVRVESIDIGQVRRGKNSLVAGLSAPYPGSAGSVRVFTYNKATSVWDQEAMGSEIQGNVEAIAVGDVDLDGQAEIIAGIEGWQYETRVRAYRYNASSQSWSSEAVSGANYQNEIQYVDVLDLYGTGQPSVVVLTSNWNFSPALSEVRAFTKVAGVWTSQLLASNIGGYSRAERLTASNLDSDPELEIIVGMHRGYIGLPGALYMLDFDGSSWQTVEMNNTLGVVDGLGTGRLSGGSTPDIIVGTDRKVLLYSKIGGVWTPQTLQSPINASIAWDSDIGIVEGLGTIGIAALDARLTMYRKVGASIQPSLVRTMPRFVDSAQIGDIDQLSRPCSAKKILSLAEPFAWALDR